MSTSKHEKSTTLQYMQHRKVEREVFDRVRVVALLRRAWKWDLALARHQLNPIFHITTSALVVTCSHTHIH